MLHFMHALTNKAWARLQFLFGTQLTNITRMMQNRDVDDAVAKVAWLHLTGRWNRISSSLAVFNQEWARRYWVGAVLY